MPAVLWLAAGVVAFGDLWLTAISVRRRVVLAGVTGIAWLALLTFAASHGVNEGAAHAAIGVAFVFLILGTALLGLGGFLEHLLDDPLGSQDR